MSLRQRLWPLSTNLARVHGSVPFGLQRLMAPHHQLEEALAAFKQTEATLGQANWCRRCGAICAVLDSNDVVVVDKPFTRASWMAPGRGSFARLATTISMTSQKFFVGRTAATPTHRFCPRIGVRAHRIIAESIYSMDGDQAPLREIVC